MLRTTNLRRGASLVELIVIMTLGAAVFALTITTFVKFMDLRRAGQEHLERTLQVARLAQMLRQDAWSANSIEPGPQPAERMTFVGNDGQKIEYAVQNGELRRTLIQANAPPRTEQIVLMGATPQRVEVDRLDDAPRVSLVLALDSPRYPGSNLATSFPLRITAIIGRDHRFVSTKEKP